MEVLGLDIEIIFFLLLLGYKHPEEVNLRELMTSFPAFLNEAPSRQQEAGPARHSGLGEWKVLGHGPQPKPSPLLRSAPTRPADPQPCAPLLPGGVSGEIIPEMRCEGDGHSQIIKRPGGWDPADGVGSLVTGRETWTVTVTGFPVMMPWKLATRRNQQDTFY